jgi:hypothetical protein
MGHLFIADGWGETREYDTVACCHCGIPVAVLDTKKCSSAEYRPKRRCSRCDGPLCKACHEQLESFPIGSCSPLAAKVEHARETGEWDRNLVYRYRTVTGA